MDSQMAQMMQEMDSEFEGNNDDNDALHRSHSNTSHVKEPANLSQPTATPQIYNNENNIPNELTHVSVSDLRTSSNTPIFKTINETLTEYLNNFHQANIMRGNNTIAFSFNDKFSVSLSGRQASPASVAYQDEMHGTKEGPDSPIKTRNVDSPGHQILDNFSSNDGVDRNSGIGMACHHFRQYQC
jgi:hypothetical protein